MTGVEEQRIEIQGILAQENQATWVIEDGAELSLGWGLGEKYRRVRHSVLIGVGVVKATVAKA